MSMTLRSLAVGDVGSRKCRCSLMVGRRKAWHLSASAVSTEGNLGVAGGRGVREAQRAGCTRTETPVHPCPQLAGRGQATDRMSAACRQASACSRSAAAAAASSLS